MDKINDIAFSLNKFILLCEKNNVNIRIFSKDDYFIMTSIELKPYRNYDSSEDSINNYLSNMKDK